MCGSALMYNMDKHHKSTTCNILSFTLLEFESITLILVVTETLLVSTYNMATIFFLAFLASYILLLRTTACYKSLLYGALSGVNPFPIGLEIPYVS